MDVSALLSMESSVPGRRAVASTEGNPSAAHPYPTRHSNGTAYTNLDGTQATYYNEDEHDGSMTVSHVDAGTLHGSPASQSKRIRFELLLQPTTSPQRRNAARLPMRVNIWPHDTTESIISTVKNFFGLYEGQGVSFEDKDGNTLIARHENFVTDMIIFVRTTPGEYDSEDAASHQGLSPRRPRLGPPIQMEMGPPEYPGAQYISRPPSLAIGKRSESPQASQGHRGTSVSSASKSRSRTGLKGRTGSATGSLVDGNGDHMHDDSDTASVSSSRRGKMEALASAEISVENIVEGGRRKRAKFDSSELPLFVPSQVPMTASVSSVSPQRRIGSGSAASPFQYHNAHTFAYTQPLPSPQTHNPSEFSYMSGVAGTMPHPSANPYGTRPSQRIAPARNVLGGPTVLPTPDPTIGGSVISDEDVALQLMRLGDASNFSTHGRTSTSTMNEDAMSGKAEVASSAGDSVEVSDEEDGLPRQPYHRDYYSSGDDDESSSFRGESDGFNYARANPMPKLNDIRQRHSMDAPMLKTNGKMGKPRPPHPHKSKAKALPGGAKVPISPSSAASQGGRMVSASSLSFQHQFGPDEEDLSSQPRCQRCRKSKKGCDRQRPCGRCKDAGIGIEGCVSEDEGNGRKGRYGRHMGVPVKKSSAESLVDVPLVQHNGMPPALTGGYSPLAPEVAGKKRKR